MSNQMTFQESTVNNWTSVDFELPSQAEYESYANGGADFKKDDVLEDGLYTFEITDISGEIENSYDANKPRRAFTLTVVDADDPSDIGKTTTMFATLSAHPKSNLYPFFKAVYGGFIDPARRPKLIDLKNGQFRATVTHTRKLNKENVMTEYQNVNSPFPVKSRVAMNG